jgi:hypothetical protein
MCASPQIAADGEERQIVSCRQQLTTGIASSGEEPSNCRRMFADAQTDWVPRIRLEEFGSVGRSPVRLP